MPRPDNYHRFWQERLLKEAAWLSPSHCARFATAEGGQAVPATTFTPRAEASRPMTARQGSAALGDRSSTAPPGPRKGTRGLVMAGTMAAAAVAAAEPALQRGPPTPRPATAAAPPTPRPAAAAVGGHPAPGPVPHHLAKPPPTGTVDDSVCDMAATALLWNPGYVGSKHGKHSQCMDYTGALIISCGRKQCEPDPLASSTMASSTERRSAKHKNVVDYQGKMIHSVDSLA